jgi:multiple sugar transport system substrate-binding protein
MIRKHRYLLIACLVLLLLAGGLLTSAQDEPVTITAWGHAHMPRVALDEEMIAAFMEANPNITVEYNVVPSDFYATLNTALASGAGPDLFNQFTPFSAQFYLQGILDPVDPAGWGLESIDDVKALYGSGDMAEGMLSGATYDGTLYGIPTEMSAYACYVNNDVWAEAGLDPAVDFPYTFEGMRDVAEKLTIRDENGTIIRRGFDFNWSAAIYMMLHFNSMVQQLGGDMIDEVNYVAHIDTPEVKRTLEFWNNWANEWNLGGPEYVVSRTGFRSEERMATECTMGNWAVPALEAEDSFAPNYSIYPQLRWEDAVSNNGFANYGFYWMANANSSDAKQAAAWKLIAWLSSRPDRYLNEAGLFQPKAEYLESEEFKNNEIMPVFLNEIAVSYFHPRFAGFNEAIDAILRMRDRVVLAGEDIDTVLAETEEEVNQILQRAKIEF